ncbi:MAG: rhodanese-like domain-containing protein [Oligoflexia bacterium]|nr:rhodanese-like domain-containing protein [Oligoflexia bacterium]
MEWKLTRNDPAEAKKYFEGKMRFTLGPMEVKYYRDQRVPMSIIDVRAPEDFVKGHVPGAINLPESQWESLRGLHKDQPNIIYCYSVVCHLGAKACLFFANKGYSVIEMDGGYEYWKEYELEEERSAA